MFDVPVDAWYTWLGLSLASVALFGVGASLPTAPPPAAADAADTVDRAASASAPVTAEHPLDARTVRIAPNRLGLRNDAGTTHATFAFGPITPVGPDGPLRTVLRGTHPSVLFESPTEFRQAVVAARSQEPEWESSTKITVRGVSWDGYRVTLVGV